jgi:hypothetical protein
MDALLSGHEKIHPSLDDCEMEVAQHITAQSLDGIRKRIRLVFARREEEIMRDKVSSCLAGWQVAGIAAFIIT